MTKQILIILIFFLVGNTLSYADNKIVKVATLIDYAPFCFANTKHQINQTIQIGQDSKDFQGYSWDVLRESYHEMGYTILLLIMPWARAVNNIENGNVDILFPTGINSKRIKIYNYSDEPINTAKFVVYVRADNDLEWNGLQSLQGLNIAQKRGFNYGDKLAATPEITLSDVNTVKQGFQMLESNRVDGFLGYEYNWDYILKQEGWKDKFRKLPDFDSSSEYLVALKTNPRGKELLEAFDTGKKRLAVNGKLNEIETKWFGD